METLTWKQLSGPPRSMRVRGEMVFNHGPDRADIHHPLRDSWAISSPARLLLISSESVAWTRFGRLLPNRRVAAPSSGKIGPVRQEAKE